MRPVAKSVGVSRQKRLALMAFVAIMATSCSEATDSGRPSQAEDTRPPPAASAKDQTQVGSPDTEVNRISEYVFQVGFDHPTWGPAILETTQTSGNGPVSITVFDKRTGLERWRYDNQLMYELKPTGFSDYINQTESVVDDAGNIFIVYEPGRYYGVIVLRPTVNGFEDFGSLPPGDGYEGRWYSSRVDDIDNDGVNEVVESLNNCDPRCINTDNYTEVTSKWDGKTFIDEAPVEVASPTKYRD